MATQLDPIEADIDAEEEILDLEEGQIVDDDDQDEEQQEDPAPTDEFVGFEEDPAPAENDLVKHLRQQIRDRDRKLAEVVKTAPAEPEIVVGARPKAADFDYDDERLEEALDAWEARKVAKDKQEQRAAQAQTAQQEQWTKVTQDYATKRAALRYPDVQQAEQTALDTLSPTAQALIAKHADNSALFMYAVGKSPAKLAELARIDAEGDPFAVVKAVTKMEGMLQKPRSNARPPAPDVPVRGRPIAAGGADKHLAKLEAEADKTGNRTKVIEYNRSLKERAK